MNYVVNLFRNIFKYNYNKVNITYTIVQPSMIHHKIYNIIPFTENELEYIFSLDLNQHQEIIKNYNKQYIFMYTIDNPETLLGTI